ncbi:lectin c-type domain-containing protein [Ditylenchus destructor]|nr:lectin c-type domain-containing protein [Ditylenchus destructor]
MDWRSKLGVFSICIFISFLLLAEIIEANKKVVVTKTVKKTVRRVPANGNGRNSITRKRIVNIDNDELEDDDEEDGSDELVTRRKIITRKNGKRINDDPGSDEVTTRRKVVTTKHGKRPNDDIGSDEVTINQKTVTNTGKRRKPKKGGAGGKRRRKEGSRTKLVTDIEETSETNVLRSQWNGGRALSGDCESTFEGWTERNGFYYKVIVAQMTHDQAHDACRKECAHLVSIHSKEENEFVSDLIGKTGVLALGWWIGMHRKPMDGRVNEFNTSWHDGTKVAFGLVQGRSFQGGPFEAPWSPGQPDFSSNLEECVHMWPVHHVWTKTWNDMGCHAVMTGGVCMKPAKGQAGTSDDAEDNDDYFEEE